MKVLRMILAISVGMITAIALAGCGGGGSGGTGLNTNTGSNTGGLANSSGVALVPSSNTGGNGSILQVVTLFDSSGKPLPAPTITALTFPAGNFDGATLTSDGAHGVIVDGSILHVFSANYSSGVANLVGYDMMNSAYGNDGDSVAFMENGDDAVVAMDNNSAGLLLFHNAVSGANANGGTGNVAVINGTTGHSYNGVLISGDGSVLLARAPNGITVFQVSTQQAGGTVNYTFTQTGLTLSVGDMLPAGSSGNALGGGRDGMAISPTDDSRGVAITNGTSGSTVSLLTGLTTTPVIANTVAVVGSVLSVAIVPGSPSDLAIVGTSGGLVLLSGVSTGNLAQVGQLSAYTFNGQSGTLGGITSIGVTSDGKYAVACDQTNNELLLIPVSASSLGNPVGMTAAGTFVPPPTDEMMVH